MKRTPTTSLQIRNDIADVAIEIAQKAHEHNRTGLAAEIEKLVHNTVPEGELSAEDITTNANNWVIEVRELSRSNLDRAQRKAKSMLANDNLSPSSPLKSAAKDLVNEFGLTINSVKQRVRPIQPNQFEKHFQKRVPKQG